MLFQGNVLVKFLLYYFDRSQTRFARHHRWLI